MKHGWMAAVGVMMVAGSVSAQHITHAYGVEWVTIGHAGNRDTIEAEMSTIPGFREPNGAVGYEYRIMRTEVTAAMQAEFVNAFLQFQPSGFSPDVTLTGRLLGFDSTLDAWRPFGGFEQRPAEINWRNAARMANWYHNGKAMEAEAFESGVYDTSTFGFNMDAGYTDQREHSLGAKVWLPTEDEWVQAMYYDPNRYGTGEEGYWTYAHGSEIPPITALPEDGGETDAELNLTFPLDVDAYESLSPLGLLGGNSGRREMMQTPYVTMISDDGLRVDRGGSYRFSTSLAKLRSRGSTTPTSSLFGFRLAMPVPAPGSFVFVVGMIAVNARRRR